MPLTGARVRGKVEWGVNERNDMTMAKAVGGIIVVAAVAVALWQSGAFAGAKGGDAYQAVFLTNNQVYFGKIAREGGEFVRLTDIFYLQVQQPVQPIGENQPAGQSIALIKLGGELHGPEDEMRINRDHILFIEDLTDDSQVVQKILEFKSSQAQ